MMEGSSDSDSSSSSDEEILIIKKLYMNRDGADDTSNMKKKEHLNNDGISTLKYNTKFLVGSNNKNVNMGYSHSQSNNMTNQQPTNKQLKVYQQMQNSGKQSNQINNFMPNQQINNNAPQSNILNLLNKVILEQFIKQSQKKEQ